MAPVQSFRQLMGIEPSSASPSDSVLLIIDAQNEYADGHLKVEDVQDSRSAIRGLLEKYRANKDGGKRIVHVKFETSEEAPVFTTGTDLEKIFDELTPKSDEHQISRKVPGSFTGTNLGQILEQSGKKKVVLTGYMAHVCVSTTARQAAELGYDVILPKEAIGDRDIPGQKGAHVVENVLKELSDFFGTVVSVKDIQ